MLIPRFKLVNLHYSENGMTGATSAAETVGVVTVVMLTPGVWGAPGATGGAGILRETTASRKNAEFSLGRKLTSGFCTGGGVTLAMGPAAG